MEMCVLNHGVDPLTNFQDIEKIKNLLKLKPRYLLVFTIGINSPMQVQNLLQIQAKHLLENPINMRIVLDNEHNSAQFIYNSEIAKAFTHYSNFYSPEPADYLFKKASSDDPIDRAYLGYLVKAWTKKCGIPGNFGSSSLRKTFGYIQRRHYGVGLSELSAMYNHQSTNITLKYLKINDREQFDLSPI